MAIQDVYALHALQIGTTVIGQMQDFEVTDNIETFLAADSGSLYNRAAAVDLEDTRITCTTTAIDTALGAVGLTGAAIAADPNDIHAYFKKKAPGGGFAADSSLVITLTAGIVLWRTFAAREGLAVVGLEVIGLSPDGDNDPYTTATAQADAVCTTEEMYVASASDLGLLGFDIDTGIIEGPLRSDGEPWFTHISLDGIQPTVNHDYHTISDLGIDSCASLQVIDVSSGGFRGSSPITFTFNEELTTIRSIGGAPAVQRKVTTPVFDGTNLPIAITGLS